MKFRILTMFVIAGAVLGACSKGGDEPLDKQLDALRKERATLDAKIREIESKLGGKSKGSDAQVVTTITTVVAPFAHVIDVKGSVDSRSTIQVAPQMGGRIISVNVISGQAVAKGQLLYELDAEVIRKGIDEVKVQLDFARTLYEKQKRIYDQKAGSEIQYLTAKNQVESLERRLESLNEQLAMTRIKAPTAGFADNVTGKVGEMAMPGMPLVTIVNTSDMRVNVDLAESFISTVTNGDPVEVEFPEISDSLVTRINVVAKSVNPLSRTFRVEIPVRPVPANLRPNTTCRVLITDQVIPNAVAVPIAAVLADNGGSYVFVRDEKNIARRKTVETGLTSGGLIQIVSGLGAGENVIVRGATDIADGQIVRTVN
jgi:RND family efflux transporter MFP subunit